MNQLGTLEMFGQSLDLSGYTATVMDVQPWTETHVNSSGGGGYIDPRFGGWVQAPSITSRTSRHQRVRFKFDDDGQQSGIDLPGHVHLSPGDKVALIAAKNPSQAGLALFTQGNYTAIGPGAVFLCRPPECRESIKMTTWNYRIIRHRKPEEWLAVHEVYYDEAGNPSSMTVEPITFLVDGEEGPEGVIRSLEMALADAKKHPVLEEADIGSQDAAARIDIIDGVNDFASDDPRSPTSIVRATDIEALIAILEDEYSLPSRAAGPLSTSLEWEEIKRRLTGSDPLDEDTISEETTIAAMREARAGKLESITLDKLRAMLDRED